MGDKICVLGLGYMGLPTASLFSKNCYDVVGVDVDKNKVDSLNKGEVYIDEKGLNELVKGAISSGRFTAKGEIEEADVFIIAVPTPLDKKNNKADLKYVISASEMIKSVLKKGNLVILESTVPPNTCKNVIIPILEDGLKAGSDFFISHCPERAIPGNTLHELINNDRIIGGLDEESCNKTKKLYSCFCKGDIFLTDLTTAETAKLMENTYRDVNIALANELAKISEKFKISAWEVIELANKHPRVNIHLPGPGVGGHCIAIDPWFLVENTDADLIKTARKINDSMPNHVFKIISEELKDVKNPKITVLGAAYKPDVDDPRESPAIELIKLCEKEKWNVSVTDPHVKSFESDIIGIDEAVDGADCIVIVTDHKEYHKLSPKDLVGVKNKVVIDSRNCIDKRKFEKEGFKVIVLGDYR